MADVADVERENKTIKETNPKLVFMVAFTPTLPASPGLEIPSSPIANAMRNGEGLQLSHIS